MGTRLENNIIDQQQEVYTPSLLYPELVKKQ